MDQDEINSQVPEDWLEEKKNGLQIKKSQYKYLPEPFSHLDTSGKRSDQGITVQFLSGRFRFCLHCGVSYNPRQGSEFAKLTQLSSGGRSTDTTILSLHHL